MNATLNGRDLRPLIEDAARSQHNASNAARRTGARSQLRHKQNRRRRFLEQTRRNAWQREIWA